MAYCPECLTEYAHGSRECGYCRVPLLSGSPPARTEASNSIDDEEHLDLVVVRRFTGRGGRIEAQLARKILEAEGIRCVLSGERASEIYPAMELIQLLVFRNDGVRAAEILHGYMDNLPPAPSEDDSSSE